MISKPILFSYITLMSFSIVADGATPLAAMEAQPVRVAASTATGKEIQGNLGVIDASGVEIRGSSESPFAFESLSKIEFSAAAKPSVPTVVELVGGSRIHASSVIWEGDDFVQITPSRQSTIRVPVAQVKSIRFRQGNNATDPVWLGWHEETRRGDRLAVRRDDKNLDSLDGTINAISGETIEFEMGGNSINAPITKLEGVLFSAVDASPETSQIRLTDSSGSRYVATSIRRAAENAVLQIQLPGSVEHSIPVDQVMSLQFAGGVLRLVDAEIASDRFGLPFNDTNAKVAETIRAWFAPRIESGGDGNENGRIAMNSPADISFRIPTGYQKLVVAVRRHPDVDLFTPLQVEVLVDDRSQWTAELTERESLGLELPIEGGRVLTLRASAIPVSDKGDPESVNTAPQNLGGMIQWVGGRLLK